MYPVCLCAASLRRTIAIMLPNSIFRVLRTTRGGLSTIVAIACLCTGAAHAQSEQYVLDQLDRWEKTAQADPASEEAQLLNARRTLVLGEASRAKNLAKAFIERYPLSRWRADALLVRGDAEVALGDEYKALFDYEEICRRYSSTETFIPALEREFEIAKAYAHGLKKKFFGTIRFVSSHDDAEELLIRVQERLPGSQLAEQAGMELADFYFRHRDLQLAAEAYDLFLENYPRSSQIPKARLRLIYSYLSGFKGPQYDASGLLEARGRLRTLQAIEPSLADQVGVDGILIRIEESEAAKLLSTANWYLEIEDPISAELFIRRLVMRHPTAVATLEALRVIPTILPMLPQSILESAPDYKTLRAKLLGLEWDAIEIQDPAQLRVFEVSGALPAVSDDTSPIPSTPTAEVAP